MLWKQSIRESIVNMSNFKQMMFIKENLKYMLLIMFMFNTSVIHYFYADHYNISRNDT